MTISKDLYKRTLENYLLYGTPVSPTVKQAPPAPHNMQHLREEDRGHPHHALNEGQGFAFGGEAIGHPGQRPGQRYASRDTAESEGPEIREHMTMRMSGISDARSAWKDGLTGDFFDHYRNGDGSDIRLRDTGHLQNVVDEYWRLVGKDVLDQIADAARAEPGSSFIYDFENTYEMKKVAYDLGDSKLGGVATGHSRIEKGVALSLTGRCEFYFRDIFGDALDVFNRIPGDDFDLPGAETYSISDEWEGRFSGRVYIDRDRSEYRSDKE